MLIGSAASGSVQAASAAVRFEHELYRIEPGASFPVRIVIDPAPPAGLFSFGVRMSFASGNAVVVGARSVEPVAELNHDGPRTEAAIVGSGSGFAVAKGCADFFDTNRPVSTNALLVTFFVQDQRQGPFTLCLTNFNTLGPTEQIFVDGQGRILDEELTFGCAAVIYGDGGGGVEARTNSAIVLNRQSGLFEQVVRVTNLRNIPIEGLRLYVTNLPPTWRVWNAHGQTNGLSYFDFVRPILAGEFAEFRVEYRIPDRNPTSQPDYFVELITPNPVVTPDGSPFLVEPRGRLPDGSFLIEFASLQGRSYTVQYSYDLENWTTVVPSITGNGSRLQWLDPGPPKTDRPPDQTPTRYYRIYLLPE